MSTLTPNRGSSVLSQHLHTTKKILQDLRSGAKCVWSGGIAVTPDTAEFDVLEQDVFDILHLIRSWRNNVAPINRIPPEILALLPDFWNWFEKDQSTIVLTHVCRAWRELFISRSSLWTHFRCMDTDKTRVYVERSNSSPIELSLCWDNGQLCPNSFLMVASNVTRRLRHLSIRGAPGQLRWTTCHLSCHAPLLEELSVTSHGEEPHHDPTLKPAFFKGDLSSLRKLHLEFVRTNLPWRDMVNLTSFTLTGTPPDSIKQLLDFFESAPHLRNLEIRSATPVIGGQNGRLVSLGRLKRMYIDGIMPVSPLLGHLLIPVGACFKAEVNLPSAPIGDHLPRFLDNLRNLPGFTAVQLYGQVECPRMRFSGPNGRVEMLPIFAQLIAPWSTLEFFARFDTSKTERLEIRNCGPSTDDPPRRMFSPMGDLRTLTLYECRKLRIFIHALDPRKSSPVLTCPKLEELTIVLGNEAFDMKSLIGMAAARASWGAKLDSVWIFGWCEAARAVVSELEKHVSHVEYNPEALRVDNDGDDSDEEN